MGGDVRDVLGEMPRELVVLAPFQAQQTAAELHVAADQGEQFSVVGMVHQTILPG
ncbi:MULTISPECIES: hypothetical protein [unclassified Streptomyces]|uniref:hypothetical protein n=1 Tax=unclassified Streptomyces TaxID=2593676 RepID=UPI001CBF2F2A|nr:MULTISPECIES: hypothetical protein [unclassified Streptomyces]WPO69165.1 hypothetical protein R9806_00190 [Streptomyces sp. KN37]